MFEEEISIPKARVAVLIGAKGATRRDLEKKGHIRLKISADGLVLIKGDDTMELWVARDVVEAIGRGFNPEIARELFKDDMGFDLMRTEEYGIKQKGLKRVRG